MGSFMPVRHMIPGLRACYHLPVGLIVCTDMNRDNILLVNHHFDGDSISDVQGYGMKPFYEESLFYYTKSGESMLLTSR